MKPLFSLLALALLAPSVLVLVSAPSAHAQQTSTRIRLTGAPLGGALPEGKAEIKGTGAKRSFRVEVSARLADGTVLGVTVNGVMVGTITVTGGAGSLSLATERGHAVPSVSAGSMVSVSTVAGGTVVSGSF